MVIITLNAGCELGACLESASFADEVIVVDAGSTDDTADVARAASAKVVHQEWLGFGKQKQFAVRQARNNWVLSLDADERVSDALRASIQRMLEAPGYQAYQLARRNRFLGRWLAHGEGYPDWSLRLFNREYADWSDDPVHEKVVTTAPVGRLKGDLMHESENGIADYLDKQNQYTSLQAQTLYAHGKHVGLPRLLLSPFLRFIKFYFLRLGFLDGLPGLVHILIGCQNSFYKYAKLIELQKKTGLKNP